jgi:hypothetical protein
MLIVIRLHSIFLHRHNFLTDLYFYSTPSTNPLQMFISYNPYSRQKIIPIVTICLNIPGVQSAGWLDIHFTVGTCCERAAPLAEKNDAARHQVLRSLIRLHSEHRVNVRIPYLHILSNVAVLVMGISQFMFTKSRIRILDHGPAFATGASWHFPHSLHANKVKVGHARSRPRYNYFVTYNQSFCRSCYVLSH